MHEFSSCHRQNGGNAKTRKVRGSKKSTGIVATHYHIWHHVTGQKICHFVQRRTIPSFTRRIFAEIIDFVFAFVAKLFIVYFLVEIGIVDLDKYDRLLGDDADLHTLIDVTQELFPIEMLAKVVVSIVEALFISYGFGSLPAGQTPGKVALNIQVITCYQVTPIPGSEEVNVVRTLNVPFKNSLIRSLTKNMLINLLFPLSAAAFAFTYNRAGYDIAARTIVVNA
ncbi:Uncharacterized protein ACO02O_05734 [Dirofilaria immitis]